MIFGGMLGLWGKIYDAFHEIGGIHPSVGRESIHIKSTPNAGRTAWTLYLYVFVLSEKPRLKDSCSHVAAWNRGKQ